MSHAHDGHEQAGQTRHRPAETGMPSDASDATEPAGGETACWLHLLCPECGAVLDGSGHVKGCSLAAKPAEPA